MGQHNRVSYGVYSGVAFVIVQDCLTSNVFSFSGIKSYRNYQLPVSNVETVAKGLQLTKQD